MSRAWSQIFHASRSALCASRRSDRRISGSFVSPLVSGLGGTVLTAFLLFMQAVGQGTVDVSAPAVPALLVSTSSGRGTFAGSSRHFPATRRSRGRPFRRGMDGRAQRPQARDGHPDQGTFERLHYLPLPTRVRSA